MSKDVADLKYAEKHIHVFIKFSKKSYAIIGGTILLCCVFIFHSLSTIVSSKLLDGVNKGELVFEVEKGTLKRYYR